MTDPIGTAQERELIETLRAYSKRMREHATLSHGFSTPSGMSQLSARDYDQAADALQSRIAEVEALTEALRSLVGAVERRWPDSDFTTSEHFAEPMNQARAALSQHRKL